jgi:hypothetical protein
MADGEIVERLAVEWDAKTDKILAKLNGLNRSVHGSAKKIEEDFAAINIEKALGKVFDSSRLAVLEEGSARLRVFGSALEPLGPLGIAAGVGIGAAAAAFEGVKRAGEWAENLELTARKLGVTTTALQTFDYAALSSGQSTETMRNALSALNEKIGQVQSGLAKKQIVKVFDLLLGPDAPEQLRQMKDLQTILPAISEQLLRLPAAEREGAAARIGLAEVLPTLEKMRGGFAALALEAERTGHVLDEEVVAKGAHAAAELKLASDVIDKSVKGAFINLAPAISNAADALARFVKTATDFVSDPRTAELFARIYKPIDAELGTNFSGFFEAQRYRELNVGLSLDELKLGPDRPKGVSKTLPDATKAKGPDPASILKAAQDAIARATEEELRAREALTGNLEERLAIAKQLRDAELKQKVDDLEDEADRKGLTEAEKKTMRAAADRAEALVRQAAEEQEALLRRDEAFKLEDTEIEVHKAKVNAEIHQLEDEAAIAATTAQRRALELRILQLRQTLEKDLEGSAIDRRVQKGELTPDQGTAEKAAVDKIQSADTKKALYDTYYSSVHGALEAAIKGGWPGLAKYMADKLEQNLVDALTNSLTNLLIGSPSTRTGGWFGGLIGAAFGLPGFASGTDFAPGGLALVGEAGPEVVNLPRGAQVIPNGLLGGLAAARPSAMSSPAVNVFSFDLKGAVMTEDLLGQMNRMAAAAEQRATVNGAAIAVQTARSIVPTDMARRAGLAIR